MPAITFPLRQWAVVDRQGGIVPICFLTWRTKREADAEARRRNEGLSSLGPFRAVRVRIDLDEPPPKAPPTVQQDGHKLSVYVFEFLDPKAPRGRRWRTCHTLARSWKAAVDKIIREHGHAPQIRRTNDRAIVWIRKPKKGGTHRPRVAAPLVV